MLNEVMKFKSPFAIESDEYVRVYQDSVMNYIVVVTIDGLIQFEMADLLNNISAIFDNLDAEAIDYKVYFEESGRFKNLINKAIATLVIKNEYEKAIEYINAIKNSYSWKADVQTECQESIYCVACGKDGLFAFDEKNIDNVIANECNYTQPNIIAKFKTFEAATNYVRDHFEEYDPIECF